jgi:hypothetical protein
MEIQTLLILSGLALAGFLSWVAAGFWLGIKTAGGVPASWCKWLNPKGSAQAEFAGFILHNARRTVIIAAPVMLGEKLAGWWMGLGPVRINWWAALAAVGLGTFWGGLFMALVSLRGPQ